MADGPMSAEEFQREFTLNLALSALRVTPEGNPWRDAAEEWIRHHVAELEAKAGVSQMIVRVAVTEVQPGDALVFTLREPMDAGYADYVHYLDALKQLVACELGHPVPVLLVDGADVSVLRWTPDVHLCPVRVPKQCVLVAGHGGRSHVSYSGTMWPADDDKGPESEPTQERPAWQETLDSVVSGQPAPEHLSEGRLPKRDLATGELLEQECQAYTAEDGDYYCDYYCARERWHMGPHMDRTAVAHAGKAGKVWE